MDRRAVVARPHPRFTCDPTREAGGTVFALGGDLDLFSVRLLRRLVENALGAASAAVVIDLSDITFGDLSALAYLLELRHRARCGEFRLELMPAPAKVMRLFDVTETRELLNFRAAA